MREWISWGHIHVFPIPMRGNEIQRHPADAQGSPEFPIPMRGNEAHVGADAASERLEFPIPMRGNESDR